MALLRRANDQQASEWNPIPTGVWRFEISPAPEVKFNERFNNHGARFPLLLVPSEQDRLRDEHGKPPEGTQQSTRVSYTTGLSLGYFQRDGQYKSTKLIDFLEACVGAANGKKFRAWIMDGGGPQKPNDPDDPDEELKLIAEWLGWFEGLEVLGSIRHEEGADGTIWARFGGPMAVGSLPGQREDEYQAVGRGKLRSMIAELEASEEPKAKPTPIAAAAPASKKRTYAETFPEDKDKDVPF
jgi:hypothetical protein